MAKSLKTVFDVLATDGATPVMNKVTGSFGAMRKAARNANMALGGMNAGVAAMQKQMRSAMAGGVIGAGFIKVGSGLQQFVGNAIRQAGDLEYELATLKGISGATADEMNRLADAAARAGVETQFTPTQAVQGLQSLAQQGFTTAQQLGALMPSLLLAGASGGKVPLAEAAKLTAQVVKGFGRNAEDAGEMVDQMVMTTTKSGMAIEDLAGAMQYASSAAQNMEVDFTSTLATLGLIKNVIPSAEVAGSAFQILTARLSKPLNQKKLKKNLGIDVVDQATGEFRGFGALLLDISSKLAKMKSGKRAGMIQEIFGPRGMKGIMPLMTQLEKGITTQTGEVLTGQAAWKYWMDTLDTDKVKGFADAMNEMKLDTMKGQLELLTGSFQTFMMELGKGGAQFTKGIVKSFLGGFNTFLSVFQELPQGVKAGIATFLMIGGTITKFIGIILVAKVGLAIFGFSISAVLLLLGKLLLLAIPLTLFFGGIALGAYGIYRAVSNNFGKAGKATTSFVDKVKLGFKGIVDIVKQGGLSKATEKELAKMADSAGLAGFFKRFITIWRNAKRFFDGVVEGFDKGARRLEAPWKKFTGTLTRIFDTFTGGASKSATETDKWTKKGQTFGDHLVSLSEMVLELMNTFAELGEAGAKAFDGITMEDAVDGFATLVTLIVYVGKGLGYVGKAFLFTGKLIGTGLATLLTVIPAIWDSMKAKLGQAIIWFKKKINAVTEGLGFEPKFKIDPTEVKRLDQMAQLASETLKGVSSGGYQDLFDTPMKKMDRQRKALEAAQKGAGQTGALIQQRTAIIGAMQQAQPTQLTGLSRRERRKAEIKDDIQAKEATEAVAHVLDRLRARQAEIVDRRTSEAYRDDASKDEKSILVQELNAIKTLLKMRQNISVSANIDGQRLFELSNAKAQEDKEDSFDNPNMSSVTQGG